MRGWWLIPLLAASVASAGAQKFGSAPRFSPRYSGYASGSRAFYPLPLFAGSDYSYLLSSYPSQPSVVLLQAPLQSEAAPPDVPVQPVLIELRGDRYVQLAGQESPGAQVLDQTQSLEIDTAKASGPEVTLTPAERPRAVLVFSDGHREEWSGYTITSGVLYAEPDIYIGGSPRQKISLAALNLPETVHENQSRGIRFRVPTSPNEVVVGP